MFLCKETFSLINYLLFLRVFLSRIITAVIYDFINIAVDQWFTRPFAWCRYLPVLVPLFRRSLVVSSWQTKYLPLLLCLLILGKAGTDFPCVSVIVSGQRLLKQRKRYDFQLFIVVCSLGWVIVLLKATPPLFCF